MELIQAAKQTFGHLYPAEIKLLATCPKTEVPPIVLAGPSDDDSDNNAVTDGKNWPRNREIRSKLLRWLCVDEVATKHRDPNGLRVKGAKITGSLDLSFVAIPFPLAFVQCYFEEQVQAYQTEIPELVLTGSYVPRIDAAYLRVKTNIYLDEGFRCDGQLNIESAHLGGELRCSGGTFHNPFRIDPATGRWDPDSGTALNADGAIIDGVVMLRQENYSERVFEAEGEVRFNGSQIRGDLDCEKGKFSNVQTSDRPDACAINADRVIVNGSVFLRHRFEAKGTVAMKDAQIGGLDCEGGTFGNQSKIADDAIILDRAVIKGGVLFRSSQASENQGAVPFTVYGNVSLIATVIGGPLDMTGADFTRASLSLAGATAASLTDSGSKSWPPPKNLYLRFFQYKGIDPGDPEGRLLWLALQPDSDFNTESCAQLARVLQQSGNGDGARLILQTAAQRAVRRSEDWYLRPDNWFEASIGYGYQPIFAVGYISLLSALGWIIYRRSYLAGTIVPTDKEAYGAVKSKQALPAHYPRFSPLIFSLENSLPLVKLGQADKWQPDSEASSSEMKPSNQNPRGFAMLDDGSGSVEPSESIKSDESEPRVMKRRSIFAAVWRRMPDALLANSLQRGFTGQKTDVPFRPRGTSPTFLKWFVWIQILLGWLFATLFVAGISGIVRKQ